ncbi:MAG: DUF2779 domain-containing protein [Nanoarchaeota archaeon]|nr:DUF2779 domain-containing protein [Nanoarchaeota archaeon]MBU1623073.1 DUF2779 domain-containing protein [Nanoarchaeota archaeon]
MVMLTKSKYLAGLQCPKLLWFLVNDKEKIPEHSKDAQHKMDVGTEVGILATKLFPDGVSIPSEDFKKNLDLTKENLSKGVPLFEAGILVNNCFSRIDILKPNKDGSYDIIEVKSGTKVKDENIEDVSFQKHCCEMAGLKINKCSLCFINNQYIRQGPIDLKELFTIQDITSEVTKAQEGIQDRIDEFFRILESPLPNVSIGKRCSSPYGCNLMDECWGFLPENHIFTLYRGGQKSEALFNDDIHSINDIPDDIKLTNNQEIQKKCEKTKEVHIQSFEIKQFLDTLNYPLYHLDFETFSPVVPKYDNSRPYQRIPFQFSLHIEQEDGSTEHISFLAEGKEDPRPAFLSKLKKVIGKEGSIVVYNQSFEKGVLNELARDFPDYQEWVNEVLPRIIDLLILFRNFHYYNPKQQGSASIKKVLPALTGKNYDGMDIANGSDASLSYEEITFIDMPSEKVKEIRVALEKYCELDTLAEVLIIRELRKLI